MKNYTLRELLDVYSTGNQKITTAGRQQIRRIRGSLRSSNRYIQTAINILQDDPELMAVLAFRDIVGESNYTPETLV